MTFSTPPNGTARPMRFIVATVGTAGDVYPFLSLALALRDKGHRVEFVTNTALAHLAEQVGLFTYGTGTVDEYQAMLDDPDLWHPRKSLQVLKRGVDAVCRDAAAMPSYAPGNEPCVVIAHPLAFGVIAAFKQAWPHTRVVVAHLAPTSLRSSDDPMQFGPIPIPAWFPLSWRHWLWRQFDKPVDEAMLPELNALRQRWGLPAVVHFFEHIYQNADHTLCLFPPWFCPPLTGWPKSLTMGDFQRYDPNPVANLAPGLSDFLAAGPAPVVFTPGSGHRHGTVYFQRALRVVERLGCRAIFLTAHAEHVPSQLPSSVLWQAYVPLRVILPRVAALVHHGGIGTTAEALAAGTPQLVLPLAFDQFDNARRVKALGVGDAIQAPLFWPDAGVSARTLAKTLKVILGSTELRIRCREMAAMHLARVTDNGSILQTLEAIYLAA